METGAASVYGEAKGEYTTQLCVFLLNPLQRWFLNLFETARTEELEKRKVLRHFQDLLSQIPEWNVDKVTRETTKIAEESGCDYLEDLLTAVFIAHTKVLSAIRIGSSKNKSIQITVPKLEHFLHRCLSESARRVWSNVYLFTEGVSSLEKQKNLRQLESILNDCIQQAVRGLLPVKNLLRDYLTEATTPEASGPEEDETSDVPAVASAVASTTTPVVAEPESKSTDEVTEVKEEPSSSTTAEVVEPPPVVSEEKVPELVPAEEESKEQTQAQPEPVEQSQAQAQAQAPEIVVDTEKARVHFSDFNTVFKDGESEIVPSPDEDEDAELPLKIYDQTQNLSFDDFEQVDSRPASPLEFEVLN